MLALKRAFFNLIVILLIIPGCGGNKQSTDDIIMVDITKTPSSKKELILQDFMDVEYIPLETNDEFINQGYIRDIGEHLILVTNRGVYDGNIFVYDRTGKALRKIKRKGQGGEEYTCITDIILDEDNNEMYVHCHYTKKFMVYDLFGNFKRSFQYKENTNGMLYSDINNYDKNNLICFDEYNKKRAFVLISKQDGSITKKIEIPVKETKIAMKFLINKEENSVISVGPTPYHTIIPFNGNKLLLELSSDTIYALSPNHDLRPFIVRTPSVQSMNPEIMLVLRLLSNRYYFMETFKNVYDFEKGEGFPQTFFMYDNREKDFFEYRVYNGDYSVKKEIYMNILRPVDYENELWQRLEAYQLVESYKKGELKGKLKEIAATLDEDSNPVIMLVKHKDAQNVSSY
ncbi:6-bladed beta-propeller [Parabacteroides sp. AM08-6]|nr:6-bladed beta-propeller [Parabacteroides sp. AM08-6]